MKYTLQLNMTAIRRFFIKPYTPFAEIGLRFTENAASEKTELAGIFSYRIFLITIILLSNY